MSEPFFSEDFLLRLERLSIATKRAMTGQTQGERRSPRRGQSVEFSDFRPYVAGDDFRRIDWNAYARLERFFIKLFVEEEDLTVHLLVDTSASMHWGSPEKLDFALHTAGALGYITLCTLDRVTVTGLGGNTAASNGDRFPPQRGKRQAFALFQFLQKLAASSPAKPQHPALPAHQARAYAANVLQPGLVILLSDLMDDAWMDSLTALAGRGFEVTVIHTLSPDEVDPALEGDLKLVDIESDIPIEITADYDLLEQYRRNLATWRDSLHVFCSRRRIHYVPVETSQPLDQFIFAWMRRYGVLK